MKKTLSVLLFLMLVCSVCSAQVYSVSATGTYYMEASDTREIAKKMAVREAMRSAVEQAFVYVKGTSVAQNGQLTEDEVEMIAAGIIRVTDERFEYVDNGSACVVYLEGTVDTEDVNLEQLMKARDKMAVRANVPRITGLIIDYSNEFEHKNQLIQLTTDNYIRSEDGTIIYDGEHLSHSGPLCYETHEIEHLMYLAGSAPYIVCPVNWERGGRNNYWYTNPIIKKEEADKIIAANKIYHFLDEGKVFIRGFRRI